MTVIYFMVLIAKGIRFDFTLPLALSNASIILRLVSAKSTKLSHQLRRLRIRSRYSLRAVERGTGVSNALLCQIESGHVKEPGVFKVHALAKFYNISLEELLR